MARPVTNRKIRAGPRLSTQSATAALATAPSAQLATMSERADHTSGRLPSALASVPRMNPSWTAMVSAAAPASPSCHSRASAGSTAEALNQSESASSSATERENSARHLAARGLGLDDTASTMPQAITPGNDTRPGASVTTTLKKRP